MPAPPTEDVSGARAHSGDPRSGQHRPDQPVAASGDTRSGGKRPHSDAAEEVNGVIRWCAAVLLVSAIAALILALAYVLRLVVVPALVALLITALVSPLHHLMVRGRLPPWLAAGLSATLVVAVLAAAVWGVVVLIATSAQDFADAISGLMDDASGQGGLASDAMQSASDSLSGAGSAISGEAAGGVLSGLNIAGQLITGTVLTLALVFFFLRDRDRFPGLVRAAAPRGRGDLALRMADRAWRSLAGFMRGTTIIAATDAALIGVGMAVLGVPQPAGLAALVFVGAYIPFVGAFLSGAVAVLVALADGGLGVGLAALGVFLLVQFLEGSFLQPVVHSRTVAIHPALVLVALVAGGSIGGLVGTLLAVPLTSAAVGVFAELRSSVHLPGSQVTDLEPGGEMTGRDPADTPVGTEPTREGSGERSPEPGGEPTSGAEESR